MHRIIGYNTSYYSALIEHFGQINKAEEKAFKAQRKKHKKNRGHSKFKK